MKQLTELPITIWNHLFKLDFVNQFQQNKATPLRFKYTSFFFAFCTFILFGQVSLLFAEAPTFEIISIEGTAKVQHAQKRVWEDLTIGSKITDNDMIETFFQTKLIMRFGDANVIILGSNSKALANIAEKESGQNKTTDVNITLFGGGCLTKAVSNCHVSVYTANAVGEIDSGSISTVAEAKTGETGFQALAGKVSVRNIAQQKGRDLTAGLTTMILPNKEPTAPLYITNRHVAVLKHFFGEEYIDNEMESSGIQATDDRISSGGYVPMSEGITNAQALDDEMYRRLFSLDRIYGKIIESDQEMTGRYVPIYAPDYSSKESRSLEFGIDLGLGSNPSSSLFLIGTTKLNKIDLGIRLSLTGNYKGEQEMGFASGAGLLDKIDHLRFPFLNDSTYVYLGEFTDLTFGKGLIVNNFTNKNRNAVFHPLGFYGQTKIKDLVSVRAFLTDLGSPIVGGLYTSFSPPNVYSLGAGFYFDAQLSSSYESSFYRYSPPLLRGEERFPDERDWPSNFYTYELVGSMDLVSNLDLSISLGVEFAQKIGQGIEGSVARMPSIDINMNRRNFGFGFVSESGRLTSNWFNNSYMTQRMWFQEDTLNAQPIDTFRTRVTILSEDRSTRGLWGYYRQNILKWGAVDLSLQHNFTGKNSFALWEPDSLNDDSYSGNPDFSYTFAFLVNDSLTPYINYIRVFLSQDHGALYPGLQGTYFRSWDFNAGFDIISARLFFNISLLGGTRFSFIDQGARNFTTSSEDALFSFYIKGHWGF